MISKNQLKNLSAYRHQKFCDQEGLFVVEGVKMVDEALAANVAVRTLCATSEWIATHPGLDAIEVSADDLSRLSGLKTPNQVWALCGRDSLRPVCAAASPVVLALDHVQDPGNLGTIIRTADWFGIRRIVCSPDTVSCFNPKVVQSTMGALFRTEILYADLPQWLAECGLPVCGALLHGDDVYHTELPADGAVLVMGNESKGISPEVEAFVTRRLLIPNLGGSCESLNVGIAAGILMSEFARRRQ